VLCKHKYHLNKFAQEIIDNGGEGVIFREPGSPYHLGRSQSLIKLKVFPSTPRSFSLLSPSFSPLSPSLSFSPSLTSLPPPFYPSPSLSLLPPLPLSFSLPIPSRCFIYSRLLPSSPHFAIRRLWWWGYLVNP
jgi:hypothetical protein